jgi:hypothetical protein
LTLHKRCHCRLEFRASDDLARVALASGSEVMKLTREDFQSQTYQQAGYGAMPERYGTSDRYVYTLEYADGTQLIILGGKFAPARRFAGDPALTLWLTTGRVQILFINTMGKI